jgi:hypothetical protein
MITLNQALSLRGMDKVKGGDVYYIPNTLSVVLASEMGKPVEPLPPPDAQLVKSRIREAERTIAAHRLLMERDLSEEEQKALLDEVLMVKSIVPPKVIQDEAVNWWKERAPDAAKDLVDAPTKSNGGGEVLSG